MVFFIDSTSLAAADSQRVLEGAKGNPKILTKEYIIRGKPIRLVIPADVQGQQANIDPPKQRLKLDWV